MSHATYRAFGLELDSSFPLPGLVPASSEPAAQPRVCLELVEPERLGASWVGADRSALWETVLGGISFAVERGADGSLKFSYGDCATYLLAPDRRRLLCSPSDPEATLWLRELLDTVLYCTSLRWGYEALHASAVELSVGPVAFLAASGGGKTSVAAEFVRRGQRLFCDDILILDPATAGVVHPGPGLMNLPTTSLADLVPDAGARLGWLADEAWISVDRIAARSQPLAACFFLERAPDHQLSVERMDATSLDLLPYALVLDQSPSATRRRFELYGEVAAQVAMFRLTAPLETTPEELANVTEAALSIETTRRYSPCR